MIASGSRVGLAVQHFRQSGAVNLLTQGLLQPDCPGTPLTLALAFAAGLGLGLLYFGGLWQTVNRLVTADRPAMLALASMLLRSIAVLTGFWLVMGGQLDRLLACVIGFFLMRWLLIRRLRPHNPGGAKGGQGP